MYLGTDARDAGIISRRDVNTQECTLGWKRKNVLRTSPRLEKAVHIQPIWKERDGAWGRTASLSDSSHGRSEIGVENSIAKYACVLNSPAL